MNERDGLFAAAKRVNAFLKSFAAARKFNSGGGSPRDDCTAIAIDFHRRPHPL